MSAAENPPTVGSNQMLGLGLVLAGALIAYGIVLATLPIFKVSSDFDIGMGASNEARMALLSQMQSVANKNTLVVMAITGGLLGLGLSFVSAACCGLPVRILAGCGWGVLWGAVVGYAASVCHTFFVPRGALPSVTGMVGSHAFAYGLLGLGLGAMVGGFTRSSQLIVARLVGGLVGGAIGGTVFAILVGFVGETQKGTEFMPTGPIAQALWLILPCLAIGFGILQPTKPTSSNTIPQASSVTA